MQAGSGTQLFSAQPAADLAAASCHLLSALASQPPAFCQLLSTVLSSWQRLPGVLHAAAAAGAAAPPGAWHLPPGAVAPLLLRATAAESAHSAAYFHPAARTLGWELAAQLTAATASNSSSSASDGSASGTDAPALLASLRDGARACVAAASSGQCGSAPLALLFAAGLLEGLQAQARALGPGHASTPGPGAATAAGLRDLVAELQAGVAAICWQPAPAALPAVPQAAASALQHTATGGGGSCGDAAVQLFQATCYGFVSHRLRTSGLAPLPPSAAASAVASETIALLHGSLSLDPFFVLSASAAPFEAIDVWAEANQRGPLQQSAGTLARGVAETLAAAGAAQVAQAARRAAVTALRDGCRVLHASFATYSLHTPQAWLQALGARDAGAPPHAPVPLQAVRQALDRWFAAAVAIASAALPEPHLQGATGTDHGERSDLALLVLHALSQLHFCRAALPGYAPLLSAALDAVSASSAGCDGLLALLPCYDAIVQPAPAPAGTGSADSAYGGPATAHGGGPQAPAVAVAMPPRWRVDGMLLSQLTFLLPLLPVAVRGASQPEAALQAALPPVYLLQHHPNSAAALAAHSAYAGMLAAAAVRGCREAAEHSVPFYLERSLGALPDLLDRARQQPVEPVPTPAAPAPALQPAPGAQARPAPPPRLVPQGLELGLRAVFEASPPRSAVQLLCLQALAERSVGLAAAAAGAGGPALGAPHSAPAGALLLDQAVQLFGLAASCLAVVDFALLPAAAELLSSVVATAHGAARRRFGESLYAAALTTDDYLRKPHLVPWFHRLWGSIQAGGDRRHHCTAATAPEAAAPEAAAPP